MVARVIRTEWISISVRTIILLMIFAAVTITVSIHQATYVHPFVLCVKRIVCRETFRYGVRTRKEINLPAAGPSCERDYGPVLKRIRCSNHKVAMGIWTRYIIYNTVIDGYCSRCSGSQTKCMDCFSVPFTSVILYWLKRITTVGARYALRRTKNRIATNHFVFKFA